MQGAFPASLAFVLVIVALLGAPRSVYGRAAALRVLVYSSVSEPARATMSPELWAKYVSAYAGPGAVVFAGTGVPTLDDCRTAGAQYMIVAPFDLRPRLPGLANASGRIAAISHLVATNCITATISLDQNIAFDSDPPSSAGDGDFETAPENAWGHAVPATLARFPLAFERVAHVMSVNSPYAYVDLHAGGMLRPGDPLRDFATPDGKARATPIALTITQVFDTYVEVTFGQNGGGPGSGDLVEPLPKTAK